MIILAIETTNIHCSFALLKNNKILAAHHIREKHQQAALSIKLIINLLKKTNLKFSDITHIALTNGPGSFTGIRIGISIATGFMITHPKIVPIVLNNYEVYFYQMRIHSPLSKIYCVILSASRNQHYVKIFTKRDISESQIISTNTLEKLVTKYNTNEIILAGDIPEILSKNKQLIYLPRLYLNARILAMCALEKVQEGHFLSKLSPLYIKPPSVQI